MRASRTINLAISAGGGGDSVPIDPDAGTPGNPVAEPPMGLDPNNQVTTAGC